MCERQLAAISEVLGAVRRPVWLRGGWAMDFYLGHVTRDHVDIDWFVQSDHAEAVADAMAGLGYTITATDQQFDAVRADIEHGFAYFARDGAQVTVAGGPWAGERWPAGMLDWPPGRIGDRECPIISPHAQIEIKTMMPVWVPGMRRRAKDAADIAVLRRALPPGPADG